MQKLEDFDTFIRNRKQQKKEKIQLEDFDTFKKTRNQKRLDLLLENVKNGSISAHDAQKEITAIGNSGVIDQLNFGVNDFENGLIDSLINMGASGENIYNFIKRVFNDDIDKQAKFFNNLSSKRKEQLAENPSFMREIGNDIIPSLATGTFFNAIPAIGSIGKNIASATKSIPVIGKQLQSLLNPIGKFSDLGLQSGIAGALGGFEGEKTKNAMLDALTGVILSGAGSLASKGLEKFLPTKSPKGMTNQLVNEGKMSKQEFDNFLKQSEERFFKLNPNLKNPLYKYHETKQNVLEEFLRDGIIDVGNLDATKNKVRKELTRDEFPKEFGDFFNKLLKESVEPTTKSHYFANRYYRDVNKMPNDQVMQILMSLGIKDALERNN